MKDISIYLITENKKEYLPLLLLGDELESDIDKYLERGDLFALYSGDVKSVCAVTDEGGGTLEVQNLATDTRYQRKGYASRLLSYIAEYYAGRHDKIILGTGDVPGILAFYEGCGFLVTHRIPDYFTTHFDYPIIEDGVMLKDKVYLAKSLPPKSGIVLETNRLILRPLTLADAKIAYYGWTGDSEANKYVSWLPHHCIDDTIEWLKEVSWEQNLLGDDLRDNYIWGFVLKKTGELFGSGGLIWENNYGLYQVGYNINKLYWNKGYTTEAMRAILEYVANVIGLNRVAGGHAKENLGSSKVLEKLGFVYDRDDMTPHVDGVRVFDSKEYYLDLETDKKRQSRIYPVILSEYNPAWPEWYEEERANLERLIGAENIIRISHFGSTSVPGLTAKPTVDILLEIAESTDIEKLISALPDSEYICLREQTVDSPDCVMFIKGYLSDGFAQKVYHIHVRYPKDWNELYFKDYLIAHPETAAEYTELKRKLFKDYEYDRDGYTVAKGEFIREITSKAMGEKK